MTIIKCVFTTALVMLAMWRPTMEYAVQPRVYSIRNPPYHSLSVYVFQSGSILKNFKQSEVRWDYSNPNRDWGIHFPICNGRSQSPIPLFQSTATVLRNRPLYFGNYGYRLNGLLTLINNGHTINMKIPVTSNGQRPYISGGLLNSRYEAMAVHFHWGSPGFPGSEHTINGFRYDMEMHIVHKNVRYETMAEARLQPDGMAVFGIMMTMVERPRYLYPGLNKIFNRVPRLKEYNTTSSFASLSLQHIIGNLNTKTFFSYKGSLTTPTCGESATWHVFPEPLLVPSSQVRKFFNLKDWNNRPLIRNLRPLQVYNNRPVYLIIP